MVEKGPDTFYLFFVKIVNKKKGGTKENRE